MPVIVKLPYGNWRAQVRGKGRYVCNTFRRRNATSEDFSRVVTAIGDGKVPLDTIITHRTSLAETVKNLPVWARQKSGLIKALTEIGG